MLEFDEKGNLIPYSHIEISYKIFVENFVESFSLDSTRHQILANFERFLEEFRSKIYPHFNIWINGSFVTQKVSPNDIDFLIFIKYDWFEINESSLSNFKTTIKQDYKDLDVYFLIEYPQNHKHRIFTDTDVFYWKDWFSKTRKNHSGKSFQKGFIELKF
jgi:hypothetical protein